MNTYSARILESYEKSSFLKQPNEITNRTPEHLDNYKSEEPSRLISNARQCVLINHNGIAHARF